MSRLPRAALNIGVRMIESAMHPMKYGPNDQALCGLPLRKNIAEIELNVLTGQCLNRRIDDIKVVRNEVAAWKKFRDNKNANVNWQFTTEDARVKLRRLYPTSQG